SAFKHCKAAGQALICAHRNHWLHPRKNALPSPDAKQSFSGKEHKISLARGAAVAETQDSKALLRSRLFCSSCTLAPPRMTATAASRATLRSAGGRERRCLRMTCRCSSKLVSQRVLAGPKSKPAGRA